MRSFVALELPEDVTGPLVEVQGTVGTGRAVAPENLHLTLAFLREQMPETLEDLHHELQKLRISAFELTVAELGNFGKSRPRLIYAGVKPSEPLATLRAGIRKAARKAGITLPHERFHPHVTLVRFHPHDSEAGEAVRLARLRFGALRLPAFKVTSFTLFESTLAPDGPTHTPICVYPLGSGMVATA